MCSSSMRVELSLGVHQWSACGKCIGFIELLIEYVESPLCCATLLPVQFQEKFGAREMIPKTCPIFTGKSVAQPNGLFFSGLLIYAVANHINSFIWMNRQLFKEVCGRLIIRQMAA